MNKKQLKKLKAGDKVVVKSNNGHGVHHNFEIGEIINVINVCDDYSVHCYNHEYLYQWVDYKDIELKEE